jgi:hypothetical protein
MITKYLTLTIAHASVGAMLLVSMAKAGAKEAAPAPKPEPSPRQRPMPTAKQLLEQAAALDAQAEKEYLAPVRPGIPGKRPFWNRFSPGFIYAPVFEVKPVEGATRYRFVCSWPGGKRIEAGERSRRSMIRQRNST